VAKSAHPPFEAPSLPFGPPMLPMLAKVAALPEGEGWVYEPKWDGFRTLVFREAERLYLQSHDEKPMLRYFPDFEEPLLRHLPTCCVLDGELPEGGADARGGERPPARVRQSRFVRRHLSGHDACSFCPRSGAGGPAATEKPGALAWRAPRREHWK